MVFTTRVVQVRFSVTEMAKIVGLSRARFYQLLKAEYFPAPKRDNETGRPYYDQKGLELCQHCKKVGEGGKRPA